eukprot:SAG11_NODE_18478_length_490_cov_0.659847_1_plen_162_part_11
MMFRTLADSEIATERSKKEAARSLAASQNFFGSWFSSDSDLDHSTFALTEAERKELRDIAVATASAQVVECPPGYVAYDVRLRLNCIRFTVATDCDVAELELPLAELGVQCHSSAAPLDSFVVGMTMEALRVRDLSTDAGCVFRTVLGPLESAAGGQGLEHT